MHACLEGGDVVKHVHDSQCNSGEADVAMLYLVLCHKRLCARSPTSMLREHWLMMDQPPCKLMWHVLRWPLGAM